LLACYNHLLDQRDVSAALHNLTGEQFLEFSNVYLIALVRGVAKVHLEFWLHKIDTEKQAADQNLVEVRVTRAYGDVTSSIFQIHREEAHG